VIHIEGEIVIKRPVEAVFDFVADERNEPRYNLRLLRVEQLSPGAIGLGARFRAETASRGRTVEMAIEFTAFERPRRPASSTRMSGMDVHGTLTFDPVPEGTRMRWYWELAPRGPVRLLTPLIASMGRRQDAAIWAGLKRHLEERETSR